VFLEGAFLCKFKFKFKFAIDRVVVNQGGSFLLGPPDPGSKVLLKTRRAVLRCCAVTHTYKYSHKYIVRTSTRRPREDSVHTSMTRHKVHFQHSDHF